MSSPAPASAGRRFRAVLLLDRDGTLIEEREYLCDPAKVELMPRAARAVRLMNGEGVACVLTTNQSGVARGMFTEDDVRAVNDRVVELLHLEGARLDGIYFAPEHESAADPKHRQNLHRRKPGPGMAHEAVRDLGLEGLPVYAIGDKASDVEFGRNAGGEGILVRTGYGRTNEEEIARHFPDATVAEDLYDAACRVLNDAVCHTFPDDHLLRRKLRAPQELRAVAAANRAAGRKTVFANGCFDLLHGGHISFIENARAAGDMLLLGVNSNASIRRLKGEGRPVLDEPSRLQLLAALQAVDYLTVFHTDSADETLEEIHPDLHAKGTDYTSDNVPELQTSRRLGIKTVIAGAAKENSTRDILTTVIERTREGLL